MENEIEMIASTKPLTDVTPQTKAKAEAKPRFCAIGIDHWRTMTKHMEHAMSAAMAQLKRANASLSGLLKVR